MTARPDREWISSTKAEGVLGAPTSSPAPRGARPEDSATAIDPETQSRTVIELVPVLPRLAVSTKHSRVNSSITESRLISLRCPVCTSPDPRNPGSQRGLTSTIIPFGTASYADNVAEPLSFPLASGVCTFRSTAPADAIA